jgi:DNA-binding PucR family transcriptional regulator
VGEAAAPEVASLVATVAREIEFELPALTGEMVDQLIAAIPSLRIDGEDVRELLAASSQANVATALDMFAHNIPVDQVDAPAAAAHYARRLAQRDVPVEALLRAYRLGEALFVQWWLRTIERHQPTPRLLIEATRYVTAVASTYIDQVSEALVRIYDEERTLWVQRAAASRAAQVRTVLLEEDLDVDAAEALTGHRMRGVHTGLVVWAATGEQPRGVEAAAEAIGEAAGRAPLAVLADGRTMWAWVSADTAAEAALDAATLRDRLGRLDCAARAAVGNPAEGLAGFRRTHWDALSAHRVAAIRGAGAPPVIEFAEVAVSAFLARDPRAARFWVAGVLGDLAGDDHAMAELRLTVLSYLRAGSSLTDAATRLHLHKNTVRYRLRKAEDVMGRPVSERRPDVEVALRACEHLGRAVLRRPGS